MIPAYDETYLPDAMANLAGAFDYALNDCGLPVGLFMDFFATSEAAALFGRGTPKYVCGMSGEELVAEIMRQTGWARILDMPPAALRAGSTPEYWAGWVLAYCQWAEGDSRLHTIRVRAGLSQSGLARRSGVTLRSIQMYEQRRKDLGKAAVSTVLALARTLGCRIEDLLEP